ncbi:MAG: hypothetical protein ACI82A_002639 [Candidatus Azotimanducaceae bacterium]|jgi:hypothetical protein
MNRSNPLLVLCALALTLALTACGDISESVSAADTPKETEVKPANNPFAAEQQLIRDAEAIQGILDTDADRKKQAVKDAN